MFNGDSSFLQVISGKGNMLLSVCVCRADNGLARGSHSQASFVQVAKVLLFFHNCNSFTYY